MTNTANPLSTLPESATSGWIGDGTDGATLSVDGSSITFGTAKRGTPYNVRLDSNSALSPKDNLYYEITLDEAESGNLAVGFVTPDKFLSGWKSRGLFYNGNLSNGAAGLRMGFGKFLKAGDTVGSYLVREDDNATVKVVFYLNGRCLGPGFVVPSSGTDVFYPCLHLDGKAKVTYSAPTSFPSIVDRESAKSNDAYSGDWLLKQAMTGPELHELPLPDEAKIILSFGDNNDGMYRLSIKVANTFNTSVKVVGKMEAFDKIEVGPAMATRMMPPPVLEPVERFMEEGLETLYKMIVSDDGNLILTGPAAEMICERYEKTFEPATSYD